MRRAALYARVSSQSQAESGTIESQVAELVAYAKEQELVLLSEHHYIDAGVSGRFLARPGLDRLRDAAMLGVFAVVLCLSPDRLARNLTAQHVVLHELERQGVEVVFLNQPHFGDSAQARFWQQMNGMMAELERTILQDRMRRGRLYRLRQGQAVPTQAPYGYRYQSSQAMRSSRWLVIEEEAAVVEQVFVWYAEENNKISQIARRLNEQNTPSPASKQWSGTTISNMLRQTAYKGTAYYSRYQADYNAIGQRRKHGQGRLQFPRYIERPAEEWITIDVPALVSESLWQAAQDRLQMNARFSKRNSCRSYLLRGLLVCDVCGYTMQGRIHNDIVTYACRHGGKNRPADVPQHRCVVRADEIEPVLWQALSDLLRQPERMQQAWESLATGPSASEQQRSRWQQRHDLLQKRRQRLLKAYEASLYSLEELQDSLNPIVIELKELEQHLADTVQPALAPSFDTFQQRIHLALESADLETKQEVLRLLIERIVVSDDALTVEHIVPTMQSCRLDHTLHALRFSINPHQSGCA